MSRLKPSGILFGLFLAAVAGPRTAGAWEIADFDIQVVVHEDATASVTEAIVADFTAENRHGIYRDIPIHYTDRAGQHFTLRLHIQEVSDGVGNAWPYRLEFPGRYLRLRIGDSDRTVTGRQTYRIVYDVRRGAVRFFPDHEECYWNLTGNEWAVPIRHVHATISLPPSAQHLRAVGYLGAYGSTNQLNGLQMLGTQVVVEPSQALGPYEGLTAVVSWAKGVIHPPSWQQVASWWLQDNWVYGIPLLILCAMLGLWWRVGRDPRTGRSVAVQYEAPEGLTPAEAGTLMDEEVHLKDITATVIDLAVRGYLKIEPLGSSIFGGPTDYQLTRLKTWNQNTTLKPHERELLKGIFGAEAATQVSDLKYEFYDHVEAVRRSVYENLIKARYFDSSPESVRASYWGAGVVVGILLLTLLAGSQNAHHVPLVGCLIASVCSAAIIIAIGHFMPRRTVKGAEMANRIAGFLEFLQRTDRDRLQRMNDPGLFERCLPYALAFGVASQWARAFEGLYTTPPTWYTGRWDTFSTRRLVYDLDHTMSSMGQSFTAVPRSGGSSGSWGGSGFGGGGFSGGGGGGGGGGAW